MRLLERALYRLFLLAFPRRVRREFGRDMEQMLLDQLDDARRRNASLVRIWASAAFDALQVRIRRAKFGGASRGSAEFRSSPEMEVLGAGISTGRALRAAAAHQATGHQHGCDTHAGTRDRSQHRDLLRGQRRSPSAASLCGLRSPRHGVGEATHRRRPRQRGLSSRLPGLVDDAPVVFGNRRHDRSHR